MSIVTEQHTNWTLEKEIKKMDRSWIFSFFGTAIGSGILFIPLQSGMSGPYVTIITMALAFSVTYFAQKFYAVMIAEAENPTSYNAVIAEFLGHKFSIFISIFFAIQLFGSVLVYSTGLNTDIGSFLQGYKMTSCDISVYKITPLVMLILLILPMLFSEKFLIKFLDKLSVVLIIFIAAFILLFIPFWNVKDFFTMTFDFKTNMKNALMGFPMYMGAINFYAAISPMIVYYHKNYKNHLSHDDIVKKAFSLNKQAIYVLSLFTGGFVLSAAMTLNPESLKHALALNISALAVVGMGQHVGFILEIIKFFSYFVIFFALSTSLYGLMLAIIEIISAQIFPKNWNEQLKRKLTIILIMILLWIFTTFNINILKLIGMFSTPCTGLTLFIIPTFIVLTNKKFKKHRGISTWIILGFGILILFSYLLGYSI